MKIRGFRIELGEIEAALAGHPGGHADVAVIAREDRPGDQRLVAYVVPADDAAVDPAEAARLRRPSSSPTTWSRPPLRELAALPLTVNGKLDRNALPLRRPVSAAAGHPATR